MRWKATVLVLLVLIVPLTIRHKLVVFMIEESIVVLLGVAAGMMAFLSVFAVFALLRLCAQSTFQWLVARLRRTGGLGEHQQARLKPVR
jgi:hypothetical protein